MYPPLGGVCGGTFAAARRQKWWVQYPLLYPQIYPLYPRGGYAWYNNDADRESGYFGEGPKYTPRLGRCYTTNTAAPSRLPRLLAPPPRSAP